MMSKPRTRASVSRTEAPSFVPLSDMEEKVDGYSENK